MKLFPQPPKKRGLLWGEGFEGRGFLIAVIAIQNSDTTAEPATNSLNGIGAHEYRNIPADRPLGHVELPRQIAVCIMPSETQRFQQQLTSFTGAHMLTPLSIMLWGLW